MRIDCRHHHPRVVRTVSGSWEWACSCGGHGPRCHRNTWRQAVVGALAHSAELAA